MEKRLQKSNISPLDCKLRQSQEKYYTHTHTHTHTHTKSVIKSNVPGQPGLYRETLSKKKKKKKKHEVEIPNHLNIVQIGFTNS